MKIRKELFTAILALPAAFLIISPASAEDTISFSQANRLVDIERNISGSCGSTHLSITFGSTGGGNEMAINALGLTEHANKLTVQIDGQDIGQAGIEQFLTEIQSTRIESATILDCESQLSGQPAIQGAFTLERTVDFAERSTKIVGFYLAGNRFILGG